MIEDTLKIIRNAYRKSREDQVSRHAAALAYYTVLSLPGLALIFLLSLELLLNEEAVQNLADLTQRYLGEGVSELVLELFQNLSVMNKDTLLGFLGLIFLIYSGANGFNEIEDTLNLIWGLPRKGKGFLSSFADRVKKITLLFVGISLIFILGISMGIITNLLKNHRFYGLVVLLNLAGTILIVVALFSVLYKELHKVSLSWHEVFFGATLSGSMFVVTQFLLSYYFSIFNVGSFFGSMGAMVVLLFWIYVCAHIFYLGSELIFLRKKNMRN